MNKNTLPLIRLPSLIPNSPQGVFWIFPRRWRARLVSCSWELLKKVMWFSDSPVSVASPPLPLPHTLLPIPHIRKGKFSGYFPCQILLAPGSSTHCHTWKESFFFNREEQGKEPLPHIKVKMKELRCCFLNKIHYQATILLQNPLMKMRQSKWFLYFSVFILHQILICIARSIDPYADIDMKFV